METVTDAGLAFTHSGFTMIILKKGSAVRTLSPACIFLFLISLEIGLLFLLEEKKKFHYSLTGAFQCGPVLKCCYCIKMLCLSKSRCQ